MQYEDTYQGRARRPPDFICEDEWRAAVQAVSFLASFVHLCYILSVHIHVFNEIVFRWLP